uniref:Aphid transmission protein n=1 Tax=Physostegia virginiana caulimovirus 2 TaxID=3075964 RepID=A0AA95Z303_9VIRU|nr:insect transmission protein factor [Physostegia virginiana caulimovirus 2]
MSSGKNPYSAEHYKSPHIYKKKSVLKLKPLDKEKPRTYLFASEHGGLQAVVNHCNNINQIVARNWLKLSKLLSYMGLEKDISESLSKNKVPFNRFFEDISNSKRKGDGGAKTTNKNENFDKIFKKLELIVNKINQIEKKIPTDVVTTPIVKELVEDFDKRLTEVRNDIKQVIG